MFLKKLSLINYKNLPELEAEFCSGINCFIGQNGVGKTNLLDTVYYLAFCKSHTNNIDSQNIRHDEGFMMLSGRFLRNNIEENISVGVKKGQKKSFQRNKKEYERLADHIGLIPLVIVSPKDDVLISEGSAERRKFIDGVIAQYDKEYLNQLLEYNHALTQRNCLLRAHNLDPDLLAVSEMVMVRKADYIYKKRLEFLQEFLPIFSHYYTVVSGGKEVANIEYRSSMQEGDLAELLVESRRRDDILGYTTKGIHKDELEMFLGEYPLKKVASQGQTKSFLVALKLAQFFFLKKSKGVTPILLLDDIFDKLDSSRVGQIVQLVSGSDFGQIFITDTNREHLDLLLENVNGEKKVFYIADGKIV